MISNFHPSYPHHAYGMHPGMTQHFSPGHAGFYQGMPQNFSPGNAGVYHRMPEHFSPGSGGVYHGMPEQFSPGNAGFQTPCGYSPQVPSPPGSTSYAYSGWIPSPENSPHISPYYTQESMSQVSDFEVCGKYAVGPPEASHGQEDRSVTTTLRVQAPEFIPKSLTAKDYVGWHELTADEERIITAFLQIDRSTIEETMLQQIQSMKEECTVAQNAYEQVGRDMKSILMPQESLKNRVMVRSGRPEFLWGYMNERETKCMRFTESLVRLGNDQIRGWAKETKTRRAAFIDFLDYAMSCTKNKVIS
ncbi:hypothetical protein EDC01DRAFT_755845 [Geopyxis carbonaria]|nr:hypothetical protein EDC01DRAFT_755845 [Geopyxis carbonaria]